MGEISIKINIADRIYPLRIKVGEEEIVRKAAKLIGERLKEYQENYDVRDKLDLLSMCALHYATNAIKSENHFSQVDDVLDEKIHELDAVLNDFLSKSRP